jgi:hypothetical protein
VTAPVARAALACPAEVEAHAVLPAVAPMPERVRFHPDVYALLARWLVEDLARAADDKAGEP